MIRISRLVASLAVLAVSACTWVETAPGADQVQLKTAQDVVSCKSIGTVTGKTKDSVVFSRNEEKVATEVLTLGRNEAFKQGGNAIVPKTDIVDGAQTFLVYKCP